MESESAAASSSTSQNPKQLVETKVAEIIAQEDRKVQVLDKRVTAVSTVAWFGVWLVLWFVFDFRWWTSLLWAFVVFVPFAAMRVWSCSSMTSRAVDLFNREFPLNSNDRDVALNALSRIESPHKCEEAMLAILAPAAVEGVITWKHGTSAGQREDGQAQDRAHSPPVPLVSSEPQSTPSAQAEPSRCDDPKPGQDVPHEESEPDAGRPSSGFSLERYSEAESVLAEARKLYYSIDRNFEIQLSDRLLALAPESIKAISDRGWAKRGSSDEAANEFLIRVLSRIAREGSLDEQRRAASALRQVLDVPDDGTTGWSNVRTACSEALQEMGVASNEAKRRGTENETRTGVINVVIAHSMEGGKMRLVGDTASSCLGRVVLRTECGSTCKDFGPDDTITEPEDPHGIIASDFVANWANEPGAADAGIVAARAFLRQSRNADTRRFAELLKSSRE